MTLRELWDAYAAHASGVLRDWQTCAGQAKWLRDWGERDPASLTPLDVDAYRRRRARASNLGPPASPATRNREVSRLAACLAWGWRRGLLPANPLARGLERERESDARATVLGAADVTAILDHAGPGSVAGRVFAVLWETGARRDEVRCLRWPDVGKDAITFRHTKAHRPRTVPLSPAARAAIGPPTGLGYVFSCDGGQHPVSCAALQRAWSAAVAATACPGAEGERPRIHDLRRSWITHARRAGLAESQVMVVSGHRSRAVFERYNVTDGADARAVVEAMAVAARDGIRR